MPSAEVEGFFKKNLGDKMELTDTVQSKRAMRENFIANMSTENVLTIVETYTRAVGNMRTILALVTTFVGASGCKKLYESGRAVTRTGCHLITSVCCWSLLLQKSSRNITSRGKIDDEMM